MSSLPLWEGVRGRGHPAALHPHPGPLPSRERENPRFIVLVPRVSCTQPVWERDRVRGRESRCRFALPQIDDAAVRPKRIRRLRCRIRRVHTNHFLDNSLGQEPMKVETLLPLGKLDPGLHESETPLDIPAVFRDAQAHRSTIGRLVRLSRICTRRGRRRFACRRVAR